MVAGPLRRIAIRGGPGSGHFAHEGRPGEVGGSQPTGAAPSPALGGSTSAHGHWRDGVRDERIAHAFVQGRALVPLERQGYLSQMTAEEIARSGNRVFVSATGRTGFMLSPEGDIQNLFSTEHAGGTALAEAISRGGRSLDCFDGFLPRFYAGYGFEEVRREPNWTPGGPDVVYMERKG